jgi:hypothetical protein
LETVGCEQNVEEIKKGFGMRCRIYLLGHTYERNVNNLKFKSCCLEVNLDIVFESPSEWFFRSKKKNRSDINIVGGMLFLIYL